MNDRIERIFRAIDQLTNRERGSLFSLLQRSYQFILPDDRAKFARPWHDPRNEFGGFQIRLLEFLDGKEAVENRKTIDHLWKHELDAVRPRTVRGFKLGDTQELKRAYEVLHDRLRQLKKSTNDRLLKLAFNWRIERPRNGYLELQFQEIFL